jgi:fused signal recognition particle receptor
VVVGICHDLKLPIRYIGIGEKTEDLQPFEPQEFVTAIFN